MKAAKFWSNATTLSRGGGTGSEGPLLEIGGRNAAEHHRHLGRTECEQRFVGEGTLKVSYEGALRVFL